eukprot:741344-Amphidinium_carterae.1
MLARTKANGLFFCHWTSIPLAAHSAPLASRIRLQSDNCLLHWAAFALLEQQPLGRLQPNLRLYPLRLGGRRAEQH